ncbi:MAG TPA: helix-turn-helix domain-containing protein [Candidatus Limnocylindria bacterium]|nr:helix-turn-helix domain-containing protein [Candidatus Limnocylindria bacterium]
MGMRQAERRARTSQRLLDAAADVFTRLGFHAATVDDIADAAGYSKGAVYGNFAGKDALFLALLDRHLDDQFTQVDLLLSAASDADLQSGLHDASTEHMTAGGSFGLLMLEFWLYAARNAEARAALAARYERMRDRLAVVIADRDAARGIADSRAPDEVAALVLAVDAGLFLQHLIDPKAITPDLRANALVAVIDPTRHD